MADRGIIIPVRNDIPGSNLQVEDLWPNTSQKNSVYDGEGQSGYLSAQMDQPGATTFVGEAFSTGSRMTTAASVAGNWALAAAVDWSNDAGHGGNDSRATAVPMLGLAAYLRERVQNNPAVAGDTLAAADADAIVTALVARVLAGNSMTLADINTVIQGVTALGAGDGTEVLGGDPANSPSFGTVQDVLRIIAGETYYVPTNTIVTDAAGAFIRETHPDGVGEVAAGAVETRRGRILNLAGAGLTANPTPVATGRFLAQGEAGYVTKRTIALSTSFLASCSRGKLRSLHDNTVAFLNTAGFAYAAADVTAARPRAVLIDNTAVPVTGVARAVRCYDSNGNLLNVP